MTVRTFCLLLATLHFIAGCKPIAAQYYQPVVDTLYLPLGNGLVQVHQSRFGDLAAPFFIHLHHNEQTADSAARHFLQRAGGVYISLQNGRQRLVQFGHDNRLLQFDPNRMFTDQGAAHSLKLLGPHSDSALKSVRLFADSLLTLLPDSLPLIAVHNNTDGAYSLHSYLPGGGLASETAEVFHNGEMDPDDFVLTTDSTIFTTLKGKGINAILQHNEAAADDGSLGYVWGKRGRSYTNVEAQHGHWEEQVRMIVAVIEAFSQSPYAQ